MAITGTSGLKSKEPKAAPKPEDAAAGRGSGWKADLRQGVRIYPERMSGLAVDRVIIKEDGDGEKMNSIYRQGFVSGVGSEALVGLKGIASAGKGQKVEQDKKERGEVGGPLVWDKSSSNTLQQNGLASIYSKSFPRPPSSARQDRDAIRSAGLTAAEVGEVKTSRCVETIGEKDWKKLVRSEYQVENNKEALDRSHRSRAKAKEMSSEEREKRWMKCFVQRISGEDEADATTTATSAAVSGLTGATGVTDFSILPSGFQSKKSQEQKSRSQSYGNQRLHMYDEEALGTERNVGQAPYATVQGSAVQGGQEQFRSVYGGDFVAHIGKAPGRKKKKKFVDK